MAKRDVLEPPRIAWMREPRFDADGVQDHSGLDKQGREYPDPVPLRPPVGLSVSQGDEVQNILRKMFAVERERFRLMVEDEGFESEEEANDFDVEDDMFPADPHTPWEEPFEMPPKRPTEAAGAGKAAVLASDSPQTEKDAPAPPNPSPAPTQPELGKLGSGEAKRVSGS